MKKTQGLSRNIFNCLPTSPSSGEGFPNVPYWLCIRVSLMSTRALPTWYRGWIDGRLRHHYVCCFGGKLHGDLHRLEETRDSLLDEFPLRQPGGHRSCSSSFSHASRHLYILLWRPVAADWCSWSSHLSSFLLPVLRRSVRPNRNPLSHCHWSLLRGALSISSLATFQKSQDSDPVDLDNNTINHVASFVDCQIGEQLVFVRLWTSGPSREWLPGFLHLRHCCNVYYTTNGDDCSLWLGW